ncbi:DMT family transporter [Tenacibaculum sp.]|uniref:DMT family transporter n=1 Tax=Tenacibaculum sp. TaxID=1906242 RepID=UPI003D140E0C
MKILFIYLLAFIGGISLAVHAGFNTQLGSIVKQPIIAVISTSIASAVFGSVFFFFFKKENMEFDLMLQVPWYLWFIGGLFSMIGISLYFYTIPKLGISKMIALGLCGQLIFSLFAGKFGWLNLPVEPITIKRFVGVVFLAISILLINSK